MAAGAAAQGRGPWNRQRRPSGDGECWRCARRRAVTSANRHQRPRRPRRPPWSHEHARRAGVWPQPSRLSAV